MRLFWWMLVLVAGALAEPESVDPDTSEMTDIMSKKLWKVIQKRLKDYGYDDSSISQLDLDIDSSKEFEQDCSYNFNNGTIIRTHDSLEAGATFISSPDVQSRQTCMDNCCSIANCNLAVFKEKEADHSCYLFDCGTPNICQFTSHPGYTVIGVPSHMTNDKNLEKHEDDLQNLAVKPTTSTTTVTTTVTDAPKVFDLKEPVPLFGKCHTHKDCAGSWSQCLGGYCVCGDGYHAQEGNCQNRNGPGSKSGYNDVDTPGDKSPDENKFNTENTDEASKTDKGSEESPQLNLDDSNQAEVVDTISDTVQDTIDQGKATQGDNNNQDGASDIVPDVQDTVDTADGTKDKIDTNVKPEEQRDDVVPDDEPNTQDQSEQVVPDDKPADQEHVNIPDLDQTNLQVVVAEGSIEIDTAEQENTLHTFRQLYTSNKGAVVALSLGLVITAILLIFVGCRLRNVKKKLRRGRPLNSNEADYLINGMYL